MKQVPCIPVNGGFRAVMERNRSLKRRLEARAQTPAELYERGDIGTFLFCHKRKQRFIFPISSASADLILLSFVFSNKHAVPCELCLEIQMAI